MLLTTNTPQVTIKTDGKVGVGTELPAAKLHVIDFNSDPYLKIGGSNRDCGIKLHTGNDFVAMRTDAADRLWINAKSDSIRFTVGGTSSSYEKVRITSTGQLNVGRTITDAPWGATGDVNTGVRLVNSDAGYAISANSKEIVGIFNRTNTGGTIIELP